VRHYREAGSDTTIFLQIPGKHGRYYRTHRCVLTTSCSCGAEPGEVCISDNGPMASTHAWRRGSEIIDRVCECGEMFEGLNKKRCEECQEKYSRRHSSVNSAVTTALRSGKLKRPDICTRCKLPPFEGCVIQGHHSDYSKPLDVIWLCSECHGREHARKKPLKAEARLAETS
jgi:hypothetical protein